MMSTTSATKERRLFDEKEDRAEKEKQGRERERREAEREARRAAGNGGLPPSRNFRYRA